MLSYTHFTRIERIKLEELKKKGKSIREIARELGRSPSSVSRELRRNQNKNDGYHHWRATILYILRRRKCHPASRLAEGTEIRSYVEEKQKKQAEKEALDPDAGYTEDKGDFAIPVEDEPEEPGEEDTEPI